MKKTLILLMAFMPIFVGCIHKQASESKPDETINEPQNIEEQLTNLVVEEPIVEKTSVKEPIPHDVQQFIVLYKELMNIKNTSEFRNNGIGNGSKYKNWLDKANRLSETADISHFIEYNFLPGDLVSLAEVYVASRGQENAASKALRTIIDDGINSINENH